MTNNHKENEQFTLSKQTLYAEIKQNALTKVVILFQKCYC